MISDILEKNTAYGAFYDVVPRKDTKSIHEFALTAEQTQKFFKALEYIGDDNVIDMFTILFDTGLRLSEFLGLSWDEIDFEHRRIYVKHQLLYIKDLAGTGKDPYRIRKPKTKASIRMIPMTDNCYNAFLRQRRISDRYNIRCIDEIDGVSGFVFYTSGLHHITSNDLYFPLYDAIDIYNEWEIIDAYKRGSTPELLYSMTIHSIRHTFCTRLCEMNYNIKVIQEVMGHESVSTTMDVYANVHADKVKKDIQKIDILPIDAVG